MQLVGLYAIFSAYDTYENDLGLQYMRILKWVNLAGIILLLAWISFMPQTVQGRYEVLARYFLCGLLFIAILRKRLQGKVIFNKQDIFLWVFLACISCGIFFAKDFNLASRQYIFLALPLVLIYYLMKLEFDRETVLPIVRSIAVFSFIVALIGVIEFVFRRNPIYEYWLTDNQYYSVFLGNRAMATQMHPAVLGTYLLVSLPFSFILIKSRNIYEKVLGIISSVSVLSGIVLTFSRGTFMGLIVLFLVWLLQGKQKALVKYLIFGTVLLICFSSLSKRYIPFQRFGIKALSAKPLYEIRIGKVYTAWNMFKDYPFFGIGMANFRTNYNEYSPEPRDDNDGKVPDNMVLLFLSETGMIGFFGFLVFIGHLLKAGFKNLRLLSQSIDRYILLTVVAALTSLLVNMNTYDLLYWTMPVFFFSILAGMIASFETARYYG